MGILSYIVIALFLLVSIGYSIIFENIFAGFGIGLLFVLCLWMAFLPLWIARVRKHPHSLAIFLINLLLGWTLLFWLVALIWAFVGKEDKQA
ncbi:MAG: superinfection immunity protein [Candidatus Gastranaerophilaceae bacterium]